MTGNFPSLLLLFYFLFVCAKRLKNRFQLCDQHRAVGLWLDRAQQFGADLLVGAEALANLFAPGVGRVSGLPPNCCG